MTLALDPELAPVLAARAAEASAAGMVPPARGDALALRAVTDEALRVKYRTLPAAPDVTVTPFTVGTDDGAEIEVRWYASARGRPGPAIVYLHGGGMIAGQLDHYDPLVRHYVQLTGVPFLAVGYRLAPEHRGTVPARDTYRALRWLVDRAGEVGIDPARVALMGDSAGGGLAAGAAILARDDGVHLARQILIYPMLDDRKTVDPHLADLATWTYDNDYTAWHALLGDEFGQASVSPVAAPARLTDFAGLPPAYVEVGELDVFRDEDIAYAQSLLRAGVPCELHVHPGAPHGFEWIEPDSALTRRAVTDRVRVITSL
jgi:acetyl esterase/lipase